MIKMKEKVTSAVAEFLSCWAVGGKATLTLDTVNSVTTFSFSNSLHGHPEAPLHPPPPPAAPPRNRRRRHRGPAQRERDRLRAARHQAAKAGAPPPSSPTAAAPAAPSTPEGLRNSERSNLDTLTTSPMEEKREEEEVSSSPDHSDHKPNIPATRYIFQWNEEDLDWSVNEARRVHNEMGKSGKCHFCDFSCEPNLGVQSWFNPPLLDHLEEVHPETEEWFA